MSSRPDGKLDVQPKGVKTNAYPEPESSACFALIRNACSLAVRLSKAYMADILWISVLSWTTAHYHAHI